jgi:hypothetical protein
MMVGYAVDNDLLHLSNFTPVIEAAPALPVAGPGGYASV